MLNIQKHIIVLTTIFLWSCISVLAGEVREFHFLRDSYASGERTVKSSGENAAMFVNAEFAGGTTNTAKFSLYVSPYLVANQGGRYTKHIYIGSQRIVSKLGDLKSYGADPRRIEYAGSESDGPKVDYKSKYAQQQQAIKDNFSHFDVPYNGTDNNDYVDGKGFSERDGSLKSAMLKAAMAKEGNKSAGLKDNFQQGDSYEQYQYFYHPDHLGSSSFITNTEGEVVQHIEYVPYGEVFIEERNNVWNTPYLFNAKEFDEETGLYYYGARYYDPRLAMWYGVDALAEEYPNMSPYNYCVGNPVKFVDPDGKIIKPIGNDELGIIRNILPKESRKYVNIDDNGNIDVEQLKTGYATLGDNVGQNYLDLLYIASDERVVEFSAPINKVIKNELGEIFDNNPNLLPFRDPICDEYTNNQPELMGSVGITLAPSSHTWTQGDLEYRNKLAPEQRQFSTSSNYQVKLNGRGLRFKQTYKTLVQSAAHELFGHLLFMFKGKDALHHYGIGGDANVDLHNYINQAVNEATRNYNDNK